MKEIVQDTIQNYRSDPEKSAAEESWDYVQFQVREAPASPPAWRSSLPLASPATWGRLRRSSGQTLLQARM